MAQIFILLAGIVILVKKQVYVTRKRLLVGNDARNLGLFYVISSLALLFMPLNLLLKIKEWAGLFLVLYIVVFLGVTYYFARRAKLVAGSIKK